MDKNQLHKVKLSILFSNIKELKKSNEEFNKKTRLDSQLIVMDLIKEKEVTQELAGMVLGLILGNLELFKVIYGAEKTIDFMESRVQWLADNTEYTKQDLSNALLEVKVEIINVKLGKETCIRLKSTFHLLNVLISILNTEDLLK